MGFASTQIAMSGAGAGAGDDALQIFEVAVPGTLLLVFTATPTNSNTLCITVFLVYKGSGTLPLTPRGSAERLAIKIRG